MQAVRCSSCGLLVDEGNYGPLRVAAAGNHRPKGDWDGFAHPTEADDKKKCPGSEKLGRVETIDGERS